MNLFDYAERYPQTPGYRPTDTSREAAEAIQPNAAGLRAKVLNELSRGNFTADEIADRLNIDRLSIRPRLSELRVTGRVLDSGARRPNSSGKSAIVWRIRNRDC